jgi:hypothetical protein
MGILTAAITLCGAALPRPSLAQAAATDCTTPTSDNTTCFGPTSDSLKLDAKSIATYSANVSTADFIASVLFDNPYDTAKAGWDYGISFRKVAKNTDYRLVVVSDSTWFLDYGTESTDLQSGTLPKGVLITKASASNSILVIASGDSGLFFVNDVFIAKLDLSAHTDAGDVMVASGTLTKDFLAGASVKFTDFAVWPYPAN